MTFCDEQEVHHSVVYVCKQESTSEPVLTQGEHRNLFFDDSDIEGSDVLIGTTKHGHVPTEMEGCLGV